MRKIVALAVAAALLGAGALGITSLAGAQSSDNRAKPRSVTFTVTPKRDTKKPFRYRVRFRVTTPPGLTCPPGNSGSNSNPNPYCPLPRERVCDSARVAVRYKSGRKKTKTVSLKRFRARLTKRGAAANPPFCEGSGVTSFKVPKRLRPGKTLKVTVRFLGNKHMKPRSAKRAKYVRWRR